jgi:hypothetical protein
MLFSNVPALVGPPFKKRAAKDCSGGYLARFLEGVSDGAQQKMQVWFLAVYACFRGWLLWLDFEVARL